MKLLLTKGIKEPAELSRFESGNCLRGLVSVKKEQEITGMSFPIVHQDTPGYNNSKSKLFFVYAHLGLSFTKEQEAEDVQDDTAILKALPGPASRATREKDEQ